MRHFTKLLLTAVISGLLFGCASPMKPYVPSTLAQALGGNTAPMLQQIKTRAIGIDDSLSFWSAEDMKENPTYQNMRYTPLCAAINLDRAELISELLALGANINRPCQMIGDETAMPLDYALWLIGVTPNAEANAHLLMANGAVSRTGNVVSEAVIQNAKIRNLARTKNIQAYSDSLYAEMDRKAREDEAAKAKSKEVLGKVVTGVLVTGLVSNASISDEAKVNIIGAVTTDLATDGKANATASLVKSQSQVPSSSAYENNRTPRQATPPDSAATSTASSRVSSPPSAPTESSSMSRNGTNQGKVVTEPHFDDSLDENQAKTWCSTEQAAQRKQFADDNAKFPHANQLISIGACSCRPSGGNGVQFQKQFRCEFPVTYREFMSAMK